jgi:hypothetical protein
MTKICRHCKKEKPIEHFYKQAGAKGGRRTQCKECHLREAAERHRKNPEARRIQYRKWHKSHPDSAQNKRLKASYGITLKDVQAMLLSQNNRCALCGDLFTKERPHRVDHDHGTGQIRGLLHNKCNWLLGCADDNPDILIMAADFLRQHEHGREEDTT